VTLLLSAKLTSDETGSGTRLCRLRVAGLGDEEELDKVPVESGESVETNFPVMRTCTARDNNLDEPTPSVENTPFAKATQGTCLESRWVCQSWLEVDCKFCQ
jgi:hypothetical protein